MQHEQFLPAFQDPGLDPLQFRRGQQQHIGKGHVPAAAQGPQNDDFIHMSVQGRPHGQPEIGFILACRKTVHFDTFLFKERQFIPGRGIHIPHPQMRDDGRLQTMLQSAVGGNDHVLVG